MSNIAERIERIPFSRFHWQLLFIGFRDLNAAAKAADGRELIDLGRCRQA
jgi:hypothetical protein